MPNLAALSSLKVQIYDYEGGTYPLPMFQLIQWVHALRLEMDTGMKVAQGGGRKTSAIIKERLKCPKAYPVEDLYQHLLESKTDLEAQFKELGVR